MVVSNEIGLCRTTSATGECPRLVPSDKLSLNYPIENVSLSQPPHILEKNRFRHTCKFAEP